MSEQGKRRRSAEVRRSADVPRWPTTAGVLLAVFLVQPGTAWSDDCVHGHRCPEGQKDGRGCCPARPDSKPASARKAPMSSAVPRALLASSLPGCPTDMVSVRGGTFLMGSSAGDGDEDEHPQHRVTLRGYCIDRTEVTVGAYGRCVTSRKCTAASRPAKEGIGRLCNGARADRQGHPVNCVDWNQASAYCEYMKKRLPSEAEWEYAARGSDGRMYPWGNDAPSAQRLNACRGECRMLVGNAESRQARSMHEDSDGWEATAPVGSFSAGSSPFESQDMAGNVSEWTATRYGSYQVSPSSNPRGTNKGSARVIRGGSWNDDPVEAVRAADRSSEKPTNRLPTVGFRCARRMPAVDRGN